MHLDLKMAILRQYPTQADFAHTVGADESTISRVIRGYRKLDPDEASLWAGLLRCNVELLEPVTRGTLGGALIPEQ